MCMLSGSCYLGRNFRRQGSHGCPADAQVEGDTGEIKPGASISGLMR